jgi:hypothetical protein
MVETHDQVIEEKRLPRVGQTVRSKVHGTLWRVVEKKEVWVPTEDDPVTGQSRLLPAVYLQYWLIKPGVLQGVGKMMGHAYTLHDNTFESNWEIVQE